MSSQTARASAAAEGIVVFCFGPLAQERARVRIVEIKQRYAVGEMRELLRVSPQRVEPFCPVFGACGGCQLQHMAYDAQLAWKREVVRNALARIGGLEDVRVNEAIGMPNPRAYRNKMALVVDRRTEPPALGFYRQRRTTSLRSIAVRSSRPNSTRCFGVWSQRVPRRRWRARYAKRGISSRAAHAQPSAR